MFHRLSGGQYNRERGCIGPPIIPRCGNHIAYQGTYLAEIAHLAEKYNDRPMDLADASLIWLAGRYDLRETLTLDHNDFAVLPDCRRWTMKDLLLLAGS